MPSAQDLLTRWRNDPALFAEEVLGVRPWSRQRDIFGAVASHTRVATRSGHKVGKTNTIACLALWWVCTRPRSRVVLSSTVGEQLKNILWPEVTRLHRDARAPIGGKLSADYHGGLWFPESDRGVIAMKVEDSKPEAFAGVSSPHVLYLIDEASGFPDSLMEAAWGNTASNGTIAAFSNPTRTSGWFFDAFNDGRGIWHTIHIDSRESPNCTGEADVPGLARPEWVAETARAFGEDSPTFAVRVKGDFPKAGDCVVVSLGLMQTTLGRPPGSTDGPLRFGLDVGRTGDDPSVLCPVRGQRTLPLTEVRGREGDEVAEWVLSQVRDLRQSERERPEVRIDVIGVGASVYDHLKHSREVKAIPVNVSTSPRDGEKYLRTRDEIWFEGAAWLREGGTIPTDDRELQGELTAARYSFDGRGRYVVESKDDMKRRLKRSPNRADAFNLAVCGAGGAASYEDADDLLGDIARAFTASASPHDRAELDGERDDGDPFSITRRRG